MSTDLLSRFQPGERLVIQPGDGDDPEAKNHAGEACTILRHLPHTGHCIVEPANGRKLYFRPTDLKRKES